MAREIEVEPVDDGRRLDRYLAKLDDGLPTALVRRLLRQRRVRVNGRRVRDPAHVLRAGDRLEIHHDFTTVRHREDPRRWSGPEPAVLLQDADWLVVNKPAGVACSDDGRDPSALAVWLREYLAASIEAGTARPEPCHRLDRGTTGAVAVALDPAAFDRFRRALQAGTVEKVYEAVVEGVPPEPEFLCELGLDRRPRAGRTDPRMVAGTELTARTSFRILASSGRHTLLEARPLTGRTHQIRAHCRALGLPILGDLRYGVADPRLDHQLLHARRLSLPGEDGFLVDAPWQVPQARWLRELGLAG